MNSWRDRVGATYLETWDALVAHATTGADALPEALPAWDAQQAVLYVAQAKGLMELDGMGTERPSLALTAIGCQYEDALMGAAQGDPATMMRAVIALENVAGGAAEPSPELTVHERPAEQSPQADLTRNKARRWTLRGSTAGPQVRAPGDARGSPPLPAKLTREPPNETDRHIWSILVQHETRRRAGDSEQVLAGGEAAPALAWVPSGMSQALEELDLHPGRVRVFQATDGKECLVMPIGALLGVMVQQAEQQGLIAVESDPQGMVILPIAGQEQAHQVLDSWAGGVQGDLGGLCGLLDHLTTAPD